MHVHPSVRGRPHACVLSHPQSGNKKSETDRASQAQSPAGEEGYIQRLQFYEASLSIVWD